MENFEWVSESYGRSKKRFLDFSALCSIDDKICVRSVPINV